MTLERTGGTKTTAHTAVEKRAAHPTDCSDSQLELIPDAGCMQVSYFYLPELRSTLQAQRVRKALLPFAEKLLEHHIDIHTRHVTLYHQHSIDEVTKVLQQLGLGVELQQTLSHFEPLELQIPQPTPEFDSALPPSALECYFKTLQQWVVAVLGKLKQWLNRLNKKQDS